MSSKIFKKEKPKFTAFRFLPSSVEEGSRGLPRRGGGVLSPFVILAYAGIQFKKL
jgi:hypothetical protein